MDEFVREKSRLRNVVFRGLFDLGSQWDDIMERLEACETLDEVRGLERVIRMIDRANEPTPAA
jgi:hypothetical protein